MSDLVDAPFRLAIRPEGSYVNAYYARKETMVGAILLGSISKAAAEHFPDIFDRWKSLMMEVLAAEFEASGGGRLVFPPSGTLPPDLEPGSA